MFGSWIMGCTWERTSLQSWGAADVNDSSLVSRTAPSWVITSTPTANVAVFAGIAEGAGTPNVVLCADVLCPDVCVASVAGPDLLSSPPVSPGQRELDAWVSRLAAERDCR